MDRPDGRVMPSNVVMEEHVAPALGYYRRLLAKIAPYYFSESLVKMVALQQLVVSKNYQITRHDAREKKNAEYIRRCVAGIARPADLLEIMDSWRAFDLCLTAPSFANPALAANIRKSYCRVGTRSFDCHGCPKVVCKNNVIWERSTIMLDFDSHGGSLEADFHAIDGALARLGLAYKIKLSSLGGLHVNVGLPRGGGSTIFDRSVYHYCLVKELHAAGARVDDNSLDPIPIIRAPFSLHYKRLTPSLPVDDATVADAIDALRGIEALPIERRVEAATGLALGWKGSWEPGHSDAAPFDALLGKWKGEAVKAIYREKQQDRAARTNVGDYLRKGKLMTPEDERAAIELLLQEGKDRGLAGRIVASQKRREPEPKEQEVVEKEILLERHGDVPRRVLEIPPPVLFIVIDNASVDDMKAITGATPLSLSTSCKKTDEGMDLLFKKPGLLKAYGQRWQCKTTYIGGLYTAYNYCGGADLIVAVKMESVWDRDMRIVAELERVFAEDRDILVAAHLLGLDFCKDNDIDTIGAILVFKRIVNALAGTRFNVVLTSDHSGSDRVPYFEVATAPGKDGGPGTPPSAGG
ncbi:MAG: hypothetical protein JW839_14380 [Candidatus Lokiarchaeota archaeon]|nr:hypothetical protein [Candidatus Lokiarchaeota archaeon]